MDRLPAYDFIPIQDAPNSGRLVGNPGAVNFDEITLHKAVTGGDPADAAQHSATTRVAF